MNILFDSINTSLDAAFDIHFDYIETLFEIKKCISLKGFVPSPSLI